MDESKSLTTREFLRNFRFYKKILLDDVLKSIVIPIESDKQLEITIKKTTNSGANILKVINSLPSTTKVENRHMMDELDFVNND